MRDIKDVEAELELSQKAIENLELTAINSLNPYKWVIVDDDSSSTPATLVCDHYEHQPANKEGAE